MLKLDKKLAAIESQRKHYLIELNRSKYAKEIESAIWNRAADLSSRLDLRPEVKETDYIAKNNKEGARQAFDMVRNSTSKTLS